MSTSLLSEWTGVVIDLPNAPASSDLTLSFSALNNPESEWGAQASWEIVRTDPLASNKVVTVGIKDSSSQHTVEFGTIGYVMVQEDMYESLGIIYDQDCVLSPDILPDSVIELAITLRSDGSVTFLINGLYGEVWVPPVPEMFEGARTVTLRSSPYINGEKRSSINELDSFGISSGAAGNAKFWTNFVQSYEVP